MKQSLVEYNGDAISTDTSAGSIGGFALQFIEILQAGKSYRLWESLNLTYLNKDGTVTYQKATSGMDLIYEHRSAGPDHRVQLARAVADKNSFIPLINGICDEGAGRVLAGRGPVIQNAGDKMFIAVIGFNPNLQLKVRGRYWETDSPEELYQFYVGLNL
jgi:hypothetical protein